MSVSIAGVPADIASLIQDRTLERVFHDALFPRLLFRSEAQAEVWPVNLGERMVFSRAGTIPISTKALVQANDPTPAQFNYEQWEAEASQYGNTIDTHMPSSYVSLAPLFMRNTVQLGLNAGDTLNRICRDRLFRSYLSGSSVTTAAAAAGDTSITVASLNGFTEVLLLARPTPVGPAAPLDVLVAGVANTVVGAVPTLATDPFGPGVLTLGTPLAAAAPIRSAVASSTRAAIGRVGGASTVDGLVAANILTLQAIINAVARMRANNVPPTADGFYHVHLSPEGEAQLFQDNQFQRLYQSLPESAVYREFAIGQLVGCRFYRNTEVPTAVNSGVLVDTGADSKVSGEIGAEVLNAAGLPIRRAIVLGGGAIYEKYLDESKYITEAGVTGKIGNFAVVNNGVQVMTNRIRYIMRAPLDRLQQVVGQSWSWSGDFPIPSDQLSGDGARFKRATVIEHS